MGSRQETVWTCDNCGVVHPTHSGTDLPLDWRMYLGKSACAPACLGALLWDHYSVLTESGLGPQARTEVPRA